MDPDAMQVQKRGNRGALGCDSRSEVLDLLRARHSAIRMVTNEEDHALGLVVGAAVELGKPVLVWSAVAGIREGLFSEEHKPIGDTEHPAGALRNFVYGSGSRVMVMLDLAPHLNESDPITLRCLREAITHARQTRSHIVFIDHRDSLPDVIKASSVRHDISLPDESEIEIIVRDVLRKLRDENIVSVEIRIDRFRRVIRNLLGLSRLQVADLITDVAIRDGRFDDSDLDDIIERKRTMLQSDGLLLPVEHRVQIEDVAGLNNLKRWLALRRKADSERGRQSGLEAPRGILLLGVPGSGKSLCAKAISSAWSRPLLRFDAGILYDRYVGESERRLRQALQQAEAMAPVILWIDEIEKAFASAAAHSTDGGLSQRIFGNLLTWMQDHSAPVFIVATANDVEALPPELLRKGRFDEIFFVDLPDAETREAICALHLEKRGANPASFDLTKLVEASDGFSGAEIEEVIRDAVYQAYGAKTDLTTDHVHQAFTATRPLSVTMDQKITKLRQWAQERCAFAG